MQTLQSSQCETIWSFLITILHVSQYLNPFSIVSGIDILILFKISEGIPGSLRKTKE